MTTIEKILLKLGIDQSQVGPGLNDFKGKVNEATNHAHKSFLHAESGGRAFHKMLHEITATSPAMGAAIRLALNPVSGLIMAGVDHLRKLNEGIEQRRREGGKTARDN